MPVSHVKLKYKSNPTYPEKVAHDDVLIPQSKLGVSHKLQLGLDLFVLEGVGSLTHSGK